MGVAIRLGQAHSIHRRPGGGVVTASSPAEEDWVCGGLDLTSERGIGARVSSPHVRNVVSSQKRSPLVDGNPPPTIHGRPHARDRFPGPRGGRIPRPQQCIDAPGWRNGSSISCNAAHVAGVRATPDRAPVRGSLRPRERSSVARLGGELYSRGNDSLMESAAWGRGEDSRVRPSNPTEANPRQVATL